MDLQQDEAKDVYPNLYALEQQGLPVPGMISDLSHFISQNVHNVVLGPGFH